MAFTYASVMQAASTILQDAGSVRWTAPELKNWIDLALVDIHTSKPNAKTEVVSLSLVEGINQQIGDNHSMLVEIRRNAGAGTSGGAMVEILDNLQTLSRALPGWADVTVMPHAPIVKMVYMDPLTPRRFVVIPGNNGAGSLEVVVGLAPTPGVSPVATLDKLDPTKYVAPVDLPDQYQAAVLHLCLYRAFLKDGETAAGVAQAQAALAAAQKSIGDIIAGEQVAAGARAARKG